MEEARKEVGEIIDRLAVIYDEEDVNSPDILREIERLGARLKELTGCVFTRLKTGQRINQGEV